MRAVPCRAGRARGSSRAAPVACRSRSSLLLVCYYTLAPPFLHLDLRVPTCVCVQLAARFDDSVLPLAFLSAKTRPETAKYAPRASAAEPALASDPFSQGPAAEAARFRTPTLQAIVFAAMRPILQRRAAARLAAALLTPFIPELRQQPALAISATTMSGKTRPDTGCVLVSEPRVDRVGKAQVLNAELVTSDGYVATASFETPWFLQLGAA